MQAEPVLELFAQNMAESIIQSFLSQTETPEEEVDSWTSTFNQKQEVLAEELASAVVEVALREVCRGHQSQRSSGVRTDGGQTTDPGQIIQTSKDSRGRPSLSQSLIPAVGSLDYPDAPPTTPFLPELERSRRSFARKLKGGLATVYLPSPPPPTPQEVNGATGNPPVEFIEHLMNSLSTDGVAKDSFKVGTKMEAFADTFSRDIMEWVLSEENREQKGDGGDLHGLAQQLAETIITSSFDEAKMLV